MVETGQFATLWKVMAERLGLKPEFIKTDWRVGADPKLIEEHLRKDKAHEIKAVCVLHSETATGCLSPIGEIRKAIDAAGHPALFLVDTISSLASADYRHDEWGVDVTIGGAQKGLMLPPGMSFNAVSEKALYASKTAKLPRSFFQWDDMLTMYKQGFFPYTPATQMLYGLDVSIQMLHEEGLDNVFARHDRLAERRAGRCAPGASKSSAAIRNTIRRASPRCCCRTATMRIGSAASRSTPSISPTVRASVRMRRNISASAIWVTSTTR
jgi:alanine-glyoxylate transaminase/serine-glyoxylate transaminase/serine-pyruvate transaminase